MYLLISADPRFQKIDALKICGTSVTWRDSCKFLLKNLAGGKYNTSDKKIASTYLKENMEILFPNGNLAFAFLR